MKVELGTTWTWRTGGGGGGGAAATIGAASALISPAGALFLELSLFMIEVISVTVDRAGVYDSGEATSRSSFHEGEAVAVMAEEDDDGGATKPSGVICCSFYTAPSPTSLSICSINSGYVGPLLQAPAAASEVRGRKILLHWWGIPLWALPEALLFPFLPSVQIRAREPRDEPQWRSLGSQYNDFYKRTIPEDVTAFTIAQCLDPQVRMYGAVAVLPGSIEAGEEEVIGFVTYYPHITTASVKEMVYLNDLFVDTSVRNAGTGRKLIEYVYEHARGELKAGSVYWHTQYFNHRAQLLYVQVADRSDFVVYQKKF